MIVDKSIFRKRLVEGSSTDNPTANDGTAAGRVARPESKQMSAMKIFAMLLLSLPALATLTMFYNGSVSAPDEIGHGFVEARVIEQTIAARDSSSNTTNVSDDDLRLDDLLPSGFDAKSCLSRIQSTSYRKKSPFPPSPHLISKLRSYEARHKRCGPGTKSYKAASLNLKSKSGSGSGSWFGSGECKYIVWIAYSGLGNRILTIASAFLYALLTDRVLLVEHGSKSDLADLFCEPFPGTSWLLPDKFPVRTKFDKLGHASPECFGHMLKHKAFDNATSDPAFVYVDLVHDYNDHDKKFFCDEDHALVKNVEWLVVRSDNYFVPSLFLMATFREELFRMFPAKVTVFHHLGRYLFHPTNQVWGLVTRFYDAYLAGADERIGIQVRTFYNGPGPFQFVMEQIQACIQQETLIPDVANDVKLVPKSRKTKAVLVTSLIGDYSEKLKARYWLNPTSSGEVIGVHQPSHEGFQLTDQSLVHNRKAWAEMYLLSLMDRLVTSAWSTFGYVAQGLGGLRPLILYKSDNMTVPRPPCGRGMSMEPCFHAPPFYDCRLRRGADTGAMDEHVRHCEDVSWGLKVVDPNKF
uniref:Fucosyltransferase n=1 Tax=Kalanchoe fedtschenkoi TaxID=63787 RepID=A0A7N0UJ88_KALFE